MDNDELACFIVGSLISADSNTSNEEREENIKALEILLADKGPIKLTDELKETCKQGMEMLKKEIEEENRMNQGVFS